MSVVIPGSPVDLGPQDPQSTPKPANPYLTLLDQPAAPQVPQQAPLPQEPQQNPYARMLDEDRQQGEQSLFTSFEAASKTNPAIAREAQTIARQLGLPPDNAERNIDVARIMLQRQQLESRRIELESPILARQLRDPEFAKMALDDWDNLGIFERTAKAWQVGLLQDERGRIGGKMMIGLGTPQDEKRVAEIDEQMSHLPPSEGFLANTGELFGGMARTAVESFVTGSLFAGAATVSGPVAPVTAPAAFAFGAGSVIFGRTAQVEGGQTFLELRSRGVDPATARWAAMGVGAVNGALELVGAKYLAAPFKATIGKVTREALSDALIKPTISRAAGKAAIAYIKGTSAEVATEVMQEVSQIVAEGSTTGDWDGVGKRLAEIAIKTAQGMALIGLPGPGMLFAHEVSRVEKAKQSAAKFQDMQAKVAVGNLKKGNPEAFQGHAEQVLEGTGAETIWMHASDVEEVLRQGGGTPEAPGAPLFDDIDRLVPGFSAAVRAEAARGGDVVMPSAVFLAKLTGTKLGDALTPHVRFAEEDMSPHEAELAEPDLKTQEKAVTEQAATIEQSGKELDAIETSLADQLVATQRMGKADARANAKLWGAFVQVQSERLGITPAEFQKQFPLTVQAGEVTSETQVGKEGDKGARGGFDPKSFILRLTQESDASSFLHEASHTFLTVYAALAQQKAHPTILEDFRTFAEWAGESPETWAKKSLEEQRRAHEAFAASFEQYAMTGEAPTPGLRRLFDKFMGWLRQVYRSMRGELNTAHRAEFGVDLPALSPEIRAVMDRMLASEDAVKTTQTIRGAVPTFQTREEAGMSEEQWQAYRAQQQAADDEAISKLTTESLGAMRWLSRAKGKLLRAAQKETAAAREKLRGEVGAQVQSQPVYRAARWLKTGEFVNEDGTHSQGEADQNHKIRTEDVAAHGVELPGMTRADGLSADTVAQTFGFETGEQLVRALAEAPPMGEAVESALDARMTQDHSNLVDPRQRDAAIEAALHNEARRRFVAAELHALTKSLQPMRVTLAASKEAARRALEQTTVRQLTPRAFTTAARRASIEAQRATAKGDTRAAIQWKRRQLVQEQMADLAENARKEVAKAVRLFRKFDDADKNLAKSRDIDLVNAARTLAAAYGLGPKIPEGQRLAQATAALQKIATTTPVAAKRLEVLLNDARNGGIDYRNLTVAQFREVTETATQLWEEAKAARTLDAEGKKVELGKAVDAMSAGIAARPPRFPGTSAAAGETPSPLSRRMMRGWNALASLKRVEHWARFMDGGKDGPFQKYLVAPIMRAGIAYRAAQGKFIAAYHERLSKLRDSFGSKWNARYYSPELDFTFRGAKEVTGALLHAGTNKQKLLLGRKGKNGVAWGEMIDDGDGGKVLDSSRFDRAIAAAFDAGFLNEQAVRFVEFQHSNYAQFLPQAQKTHKAIFGYEFETLELSTIHTPFGDIDGGYVPARADRDEMAPRVEDGNFADLEDEFRKSLMPPGNKGFTLARDENYNQPLILDLGKQLSAIDEEIRFINLQPAVKDALRIVKDRDFQNALEPYDRAATNAMLMPWLDNTARQTVSRPSGMALVDMAASWLRHASSLVALGFNVINAAIQATGISSAVTQVQGKYLRSALMQWARHPVEAVRTIMGQSEFMRQRFDASTRKLREDITRMTSDKALRNVTVVQQVAARAAFFLQRMVQGSVDIVTWQGGYAEAIASGKSEAEAVEAADSAVRRAQGSGNPEDLPAYETGTPFVRLFSQFGSFSNVMLNQILGAQPGWNRVKAIGWALFVPALLEGVLRTVLMGGPDDKDDDGTIDEWAAIFGRNLARNAAGLIPVAGPALMALAESEGSRVQTPFEVLGRATKGLYELLEAAGGGETTPSEAKAIAAFLTIATGIPIAAPARYILPAQSAGAR